MTGLYKVKLRTLQMHTCKKVFLNLPVEDNHLEFLTSRTQRLPVVASYFNMEVWRCGAHSLLFPKITPVIVIDTLYLGTS